MDNNEQHNSEIDANLSNDRNEKKKKSKFSTKRLLGIAGGTILALAVAFGGGIALSQFPATVAQTSSDQSSQIISQKSDPAPTSNTNVGTTPNAGVTTGTASTANISNKTAPVVTPVTAPPSTNAAPISDTSSSAAPVSTTPAATTPRTNISAPTTPRANTGAAPASAPGVNAGTGNLAGAANANNDLRQRDQRVGAATPPRNRP